MTTGFISGFLKEARAHGCTVGEAYEVLKLALATGAFPSTPPNPNPPIVDSLAPSRLFPVAGTNPGATTGPSSTGGLGSLAPAAPTPGFNINQTGLGGVNNSVNSAPSSSVNSVLNKAVTPSTTPVPSI